LKRHRAVDAYSAKTLALVASLGRQQCLPYPGLPNSLLLLPLCDHLLEGECMKSLKHMQA